MARSCGIRIGPRRFELVVLDGSPKRHRIAAFKASEFPRGEGDPVAAAVSALKDAAKTHKVPTENVAIAVDTGLAAFRTVKLPFTDVSKIEDVIKFEIEAELPQWNIDDVICDFITLQKAENQSHLLVSAVPKEDIAHAIDLCARANIEPLEAELEVTAMVNAALAADVCNVDDAQILVHVGETSTSVVVMDGGQVRSLRAIHIGALSHDPRGHDEPADEPADEEEGEEGEADEREDTPAAVGVSADELRRRQEHALSRIRRELGRTVSGARTANPLEAIYVCGIEIPDLIGTEIIELPVYELDVFEEDGGQPAEGTMPLVVAYGTALRQLGGEYIPASLRREELRYAGTFERVELPIAVGALLLVTWLAVFNIFEYNQYLLRNVEVDLWRRSTNNFLMGDKVEGTAGSLDLPLDAEEHPAIKYIERIRAENQEPGMSAKENPEVDPDRTRLEQMREVKRQLTIAVGKLDEELGNTGEVTQPQSALEGLTLVTGVLSDPETGAGRVAIRQADAEYQRGQSRRPDQVVVKLDLTFFADSSVEASRNMESFTATLKEQPWFLDQSDRGSDALEEASGISITGYQVTCDLSKVER